MKFKNTPPRNRRLSLAKNWIPTYDGKNLVKGYRKYFGVSMLCAVYDLKILGYEFTDEYIKQLKRNEEKHKQKRKQKELRKLTEELDLIEQNEYFYYIAGYTSGGAPYGITWEQAESEGLLENNELDKDNTEDLPF